MSPAEHRAAAELLGKIADSESTAALRAELHAIAGYHAAAALAVREPLGDLTDCRVHRPDPLLFS